MGLIVCRSKGLLYKVANYRFNRTVPNELNSVQPLSIDGPKSTVAQPASQNMIHMENILTILLLFCNRKKTKYLPNKSLRMFIQKAKSFEINTKHALLYLLLLLLLSDSNRFSLLKPFNSVCHTTTRNFFRSLTENSKKNIKAGWLEQNHCQSGKSL